MSERNWSTDEQATANPDENGGNAGAIFHAGAARPPATQMRLRGIVRLNRRLR